ncbi:thiol-disulfide oxidoreductase DCC family protein [Methylacidimicrobium sp. B4]|uniref:thiol-disulfide oxidoreductase DCC family protein n=1 Tax=Methylacidimicrobium sp. B4 TaxID=2796139 RepID=UPI001A8FB854|nr:DCC1-like thiol-disulfide oxidoreductase family protein [Methylacidimicrobium sp. B4]QSR85655.1 DUF393 domain-containing protein [Methylacidimicrobium sp. B4]
MGIIFFDGGCGLCNRFVWFVLRHDRKRVFRFAPLQGARFRREAERSGPLAGSESVVVVWEEEGRREVLLRGRAVVRVLRQLPRFRWLATLLGVLPEPWLDRFYDLVAARRYRLSGKGATCRRPNEEEERYFLD